MNFDGIFFNVDDYMIEGNDIGEGVFGRVYVCRSREDNQRYALKKIIINSQNTFSGTEQMYFMRESTILHQVTHPAIVKFVGINFQSFDDIHVLSPSIITEFIPNGSLQEVLAKGRSRNPDINFTATKKYIFILGISHAMKYLHKNGIVHRDLKPANILIDSNYFPKICDFGLARCFPRKARLVMTGQIGSPAYMAPELLSEDQLEYKGEIDVYAFSMILFEIASGKVPYSELDVGPFSLTRRVLDGYRPERKEGINDKMWRLIEKCWDQNPTERYSFEELFDLFSNDFTYLDQPVNAEEINNYLRSLNDPQFVRRDAEIKSNLVHSIQSQTESLYDMLENACEEGNVDLFNQILSREVIDINHKYIVHYIGYSFWNFFNVFFSNFNLNNSIKFQKSLFFHDILKIINLIAFLKSLNFHNI